METKFQTSFIPKKPLTAQENVRVHAPTSILMVIGMIVFLVSLAGAALTFAGKIILLRSQEQLSIDLQENEKRFNLPLIEDLKKASQKIELASQLIKSHVAVSEALNIVGGLTADRVRFSSFEFSSGSSDTAGASSLVIAEPQRGPSYKIKMKGVTDTYNSVAFQSDVFGRSEQYGTNKILRNPVLSDLTVDQLGNITFNFAADVSLDDISYEKVLSGYLESESLPVGGIEPENL